MTQSNLISTPASPASPVDATVAADGFFPDIDVNALRDAIRIGEGVVPHARLVPAIEGAILTAMRAVSKWRTKMALAGHETTATIYPEDTINGKLRVDVLWQRIVRYETAAELADTHRDISATDQANIRADEDLDSADKYRRRAHEALTDLLSIGADDVEGVATVGRNMVELL